MQSKGGEFCNLSKKDVFENSSTEGTPVLHCADTYIECSWTPALHYCTRPDACRNVDMVLSHKKDVSRLSQYLTLQLLSGDQVSAVHAAGPAPVH